MNWQIKELENRSILSFSDAHSPAKMGREVTAMELEKANYPSIREAIMQPSLKGVKGDKRVKSTKGRTIPFDAFGSSDAFDSSRIAYTIEFYPEEGKYHYSGHRNCQVIFGPEDVTEKGMICPVCHRRLTEGVMTRVQHLSTNFSQRKGERLNKQGLRWLTDTKKIKPPFIKMVPLLEIIAESLGVGVGSKKVGALYQALIEKCGDELTILLHTPIARIEKDFGSSLAEAIRKVRKGDISIHPGYDNVYGVVKIWDEETTSPRDTKQMSLL
jgi:PHP family Zn ribbon phosphoesterase